MEIRYEHENGGNYLVIQQDEIQEDTFQMKMLYKTKPDHFLKFSESIVNNNSILMYEISSKQPLGKVYEYGKMTLEDVKNICVNVSEMMRTVKAYMLDADMVFLEPKYIYMNLANKKLDFVYCPQNDKTFSEGLKILFEYILEHFDHSLDKENVVKLYEVYQKVLMEDYDAFNLIKLFSMPENNSNTVVKTVVPQVIEEDREVAEADFKRENKMGIACMALIVWGVINICFSSILPFDIGMKFSISFIVAGVAGIIILKHLKGKMRVETVSVPFEIKKESTVRGAVENPENDRVKDNIFNNVCNETILLSDFYNSNKEKRFSLHYISDGMNDDFDIRIKDDGYDGNVLADSKSIKENGVISVDRYPYVIGSLERLSDVVIDAKVISRMHATVIKDKGKYYIEDMNSTNGTFVNDRRVELHKKVEICDGDVIKLAMIMFRVNIQ